MKWTCVGRVYGCKTERKHRKEKKERQKVDGEREKEKKLVHG